MKGIKMQEKWTLIEAQSQYCSPSVVGTVKHYHPLDTLQHQWTSGDAQAGRCLVEEVGTSRLPPFAALLPPADYVPPEPPVPEITPTDEELNMVALIREAFNHIGGTEQFKKEAAKNPGELYRAMLKMGVAQVAKEAPPTLPNLDDITDEQVATLSSNELKRILLNSVEIKTGKQLDDALGA